MFIETARHIFKAPFGEAGIRFPERRIVFLLVVIYKHFTPNGVKDLF